ncbi:MAG: flavodoxin domain-containing protein [Draconibacterium sp.]
MILPKLFASRNKRQLSNKLLILYGTKTGNSKAVAEELERQLKKRKLSPKLASFGKITPGHLLNVNTALMVVSTHDNGEPPQNTQSFYRQLFDHHMQELPHLKYAVCSLGDSAYDTFCEAGKKLDQRLVQLGALPMTQRVDCDEKFADDAANWIKQLIKILGNNMQKAEVAPLTKDNWHTGILESSELLSTDKNGNETRHLIFSADTAYSDFKPGDVIELIPPNPDKLVREICGLLGTEKYKHDLKHTKEISRINKTTLKAYFSAANPKTPTNFFTDEDASAIYLKTSNIADVLKDFPGEITPEVLLALLPKIRGRRFSISNNAKADQKTELMVKTLRFTHRDRLHEGAASTFINEVLQPGNPIRFRHIESTDFHLPEDQKTPLLLFANGTGLAPFRGFLQHLQTNGFPARVWLIWGDRQQSAQNRYVSEIKTMADKYTHFLLDLVESQNKQELKYVQDVLSLKTERLREFLDNKAHVYICGSNAMATKVEEIIRLTITQKDTINADEYWQDFMNSGRFHSSIY